MVNFTSKCCKLKGHKLCKTNNIQLLHIHFNNWQIIATEITDNNLAEINLRAEGLDKRDFLGRSALFVQVFREEDPNQWILVWKTEV